MDHGDVATQGEGAPVGVLRVVLGSDDLLRDLEGRLVVSSGGDLKAPGSISAVSSGQDGVLA